MMKFTVYLIVSRNYRCIFNQSQTWSFAGANIADRYDMELIEERMKKVRSMIFILYT